MSTPEQDLVNLLERNPDIAKSLMAVIKKASKKSNSGESIPEIPGLEDVNSGNREKILTELMKQMAANTQAQTKMIASLGKTVENTNKLAKTSKELRAIGADFQEVGRMFLMYGSLAGMSIFAFILTMVMIKNAIVDTVKGLNPFNNDSQSQPKVGNVSTFLSPPQVVEGGTVMNWTVTSGFNPNRKHPITGQIRPHEGIDLGTDIGVSVYAPFATDVTCPDHGSEGWGLHAEMTKGNTLIRLAHLSDCIPGPKNAGDVVGATGNSGGSTGPHLHIEQIVNNTPINPTLDYVLAVMKGVDYQTLNTIFSQLYPAIVEQESGGDHTATNDASGDTAIGLTQVMEYNVESWSTRALGKPVTEAEFMHDPQLQTTVASYEMYQQIIRNWTGDSTEIKKRVAAEWYSGRPDEYANYSPIPGQPESPSIGDYVDSVIGKVKDGASGSAVLSKSEPQTNSQSNSQSKPQSSPKINSQGTSTLSHVQNSVFCIQTEGGCASGVAVSATRIITAAHVVSDNPTVVVEMAGNWVMGTVIKKDASVDLALVEVPDAKFTPVNFINNLSVGDSIKAIGYPLGVRNQKTTEGSVIGLDRECGVPSAKCIEINSGVLMGGNSGGALVKNSSVVGINVSISKNTQNGYAIPTDIVLRFLN